MKQSKRRFNIAGPCIVEDHYLVSPLERVPEIKNLILSKSFFLLHAPRQCGKTTTIVHYVQELNKEGQVYALYCSLENVQQVEQAESGIPAIIDNMKTAFVRSRLPHSNTFAGKKNVYSYSTMLQNVITDICEILDRPLVIFFDEADCLSNHTLVSFLRQLRNGYIGRAQKIPFPVSVGLIGLKSIRDYKASVRENDDTLGTSSPFNVVSKSLTMHNFSLADIQDLYHQHTAETGQRFEENICACVMDWTDGQPWLVNAIANCVNSRKTMSAP